MKNNRQDGLKSQAYADAALEYAEAGLPVFPCGRDKKPLTKHGFKDATTDQTTIKDWWSKWPDASIGMPTGSASGVWVVDIDLPDGPSSWGELLKGNGDLTTRKQQTGSGGWQLFFKYNGAEIKNSAGKIGTNIDVRGAGGYVILPPSSHPSGNNYQWLEESQPIDAPEWLVDLATKAKPEEKAQQTTGGTSKYGLTALHAEAEKVRTATNHTRNDTLNRSIFAIGHLVGGGEVSQSMAENLLLEAALAVGLEEKEARATIKSGLTAGMAQPRTADEPKPEEKKRTVAEMLVDLVPDDILFHDADGKAYADIEIYGHRETWAIRSKAFKSHLSFQLFKEHNRTPASQSLQDALGTIEGKALFMGPERSVNVRIGEHDRSVYLDLGRPDWSAVEITAEGWRVVTNPAIRFWRPAGMRPLPEPEHGGSVDHLYSLLNLTSDDSFKLIIGWLLSALRPSGPYPVATFGGEQGTGKSTAGGFLRSLIDPNIANLRTTARCEQDLIIAAKNGWVIALDNLSGVKPWLSDALCRIATGGGFGTRQLYTDGDEVLIQVQRPVIINGIEELCTRGDLADRAIVVDLPVIGKDKRMTEKDLNHLFESAKAKILGGLLDAVVSGLKYQDEIKLADLPRMADAATWWCACERGGTLSWSEGGILDAFQRSRDGIIESYVESDEVAAEIVRLLKNQDQRGGITGTASELLAALDEQRGDNRSRFWPATPKALAGRIRRASPFLREYGVMIKSIRKHRGRLFDIDYTGNLASQQSQQTQTKEYVN